MWLDIAEFILKLLTGEVWHIWLEHKAWEAINIKNQNRANIPLTDSEWNADARDNRL